jgi:hypothetical protein
VFGGAAPSCARTPRRAASSTRPRPKASTRPQRPGISRSSRCPMPTGRAGSTTRCSPIGSRPSIVRSRSRGARVDQACGLQAVGYWTGYLVTERSYPRRPRAAGPRKIRRHRGCPPRSGAMRRNMFGPGRGGWDEEWKGWWGDEPPYHAPVFVVTHHPRAPLPMRGHDGLLRHRRGRVGAGSSAEGRG